MKFQMVDSFWSTNCSRWVELINIWNSACFHHFFLSPFRKAVLCLQHSARCHWNSVAFLAAFPQQSCKWIDLKSVTVRLRLSIVYTVTFISLYFNRASEQWTATRVSGGKFFSVSLFSACNFWAFWQWRRGFNFQFEDYGSISEPKPFVNSPHCQQLKIFSRLHKSVGTEKLFSQQRKAVLIEAIQNLFWKLNSPALVAYIRGDSLWRRVCAKF